MSGLWVFSDFFITKFCQSKNYIHTSIFSAVITGQLVIKVIILIYKSKLAFNVKRLKSGGRHDMKKKKEKKKERKV